MLCGLCEGGGVEYKVYYIGYVMKAICCQNVCAREQTSLQFPRAHVENSRCDPDIRFSSVLCYVGIAMKSQEYRFGRV